MQERKVHYIKEYAQFLEYLAAGRTLDEQFDDCKKTGNHASAAILRSSLLRSIGARGPKADAENFIVWSCYVPFMSTMKLRDSITLLNELGIEYNYSEAEVCCGAPMLKDSVELVGVSEDIQQKVATQAREMMQINNGLAEKGGQKTMLYACQMCTCIAKKAFPEERERHRYVYDVIVDKMEKLDLEVTPMTIGFFEGCHKFYPHNGNLDWKRYRGLLDKVKGLEVVDLPRKICCKEDAEAILAHAESHNLTTIVAADGDCPSFLNKAAAARGGKITIKHLPEVLLEILGK